MNWLIQWLAHRHEPRLVRRARKRVRAARQQQPDLDAKTDAALFEQATGLAPGAGAMPDVPFAATALEFAKRVSGRKPLMREAIAGLLMCTGAIADVPPLIARPRTLLLPVLCHVASGRRVHVVVPGQLLERTETLLAKLAGRIGKSVAVLQEDDVAEVMARRLQSDIVISTATTAVSALLTAQQQGARWPDAGVVLRTDAVLDQADDIHKFEDARLPIVALPLSWTHLSGLSAVAMPDARVYEELWGCPVVDVAPRRRHNETQDTVYLDDQAKARGIAKVIATHRGQRPVLVWGMLPGLVGLIQEELRPMGIVADVLSGDPEQDEPVRLTATLADAVTLCADPTHTGRIPLPPTQSQRDAFHARGGMVVLIGERSYLRRHDEQLAARASFGEVQYFVALEDALLSQVLFRSKRRREKGGRDGAVRVRALLGQSGDPIESPLVHRAIRNAQRKLSLRQLDRLRPLCPEAEALRAWIAGTAQMPRNLAALQQARLIPALSLELEMQVDAERAGGHWQLRIGGQRLELRRRDAETWEAIYLDRPFKAMLSRSGAGKEMCVHLEIRQHDAARWTRIGLTAEVGVLSADVDDLPELACDFVRIDAPAMQQLLGRLRGAGVAMNTSVFV